MLSSKHSPKYAPRTVAPTTYNLVKGWARPKAVAARRTATALAAVGEAPPAATTAAMPLCKRPRNSSSSPQPAARERSNKCQALQRRNKGTTTASKKSRSSRHALPGADNAAPAIANMGTTATPPQASPSQVQYQREKGSIPTTSPTTHAISPRASSKPPPTIKIRRGGGAAVHAVRGGMRGVERMDLLWAVIVGGESGPPQAPPARPGRDHAVPRPAQSLCGEGDFLSNVPRSPKRFCNPPSASHRRASVLSRK